MQVVFMILFHKIFSYDIIYSMSENFKIRVIVGLVLFIIVVAALYTFDGIPLKIIYAFFVLMAAIELASFYKKKHTFDSVMLSLVEFAFLVASLVIVAKADPVIIWYIIFGAPGYDVFAYFSGKLLGGKIFGKSRPFPKISKNKTWEGTIIGLIISYAMVITMFLIRGNYAAEWMYLFLPVAALIGDLFESYLKRKFDIKDSNEIVIKNKLFSKIEIIVGGSNGHGGFLDRIDSIAFATSVLLIIVAIMV